MSLSCCNKNGATVQPITAFTTKLESESKSHRIVLDTQKELTDNSSDFNANLNVQNFNPKKYIAHSLHGKIIAQPLVVQDTLYVLNNFGYVYAYDKKTFKPKWHAYTGSSSANKKYIDGGISYNNGRLYVTNGTRDLSIINANTGDIITVLDLPSVAMKKPIVSNSKVIASLNNNSIIAFDIDTFKRAWVNSNPGDILAYDSGTFPTIYKDQVIVIYSSGNLVSYNIDTGHAIWGYNISDNQEDVFLPDLVVAGSSCQPLLSGNLLYVPSSSGNMFIFDLDHKNLVKIKKNVQDIQNITHSGNAIFVVNNAKQAAALSEHAEVIWAQDLSANEKKSSAPERFLPAVVINDKLFIISAKGKLYELSYQDGALNNKLYSIPKNAISVLCYDGKFYIVTETKVLEF